MSKVPILSKQRLEEIADTHTQAFARFDGKDEPKFSVWKFAVHYLGKKVRYEWLSNTGVYLGLSVFSDHTPVLIYNPETQKVSLQKIEKDTILLDRTLDVTFPGSTSKPRFTLMHECAHHILHRDYFLCLNQEGNNCGVAYSLQKRKDIPGDEIKQPDVWTEEDWLEWQADFLAGALLMPRHRVRRFMEESILFPEYQDSVRAKQPEEVAYEILVSRLAGVFKVSPTTARIRLEHTGFQRLPNLSVKKPSQYNLLPIPEPIKKSARERRNDEILADWENRRLDPEYIFPGPINKTVKKKRRISHAREKA